MLHSCLLHRNCDAEEILTQGDESRDFDRAWSELLCGGKSNAACACLE
jgi:hypothetical protein